MNKKEIISIAGTLGSGKSSTADRVAKHLGYERFSSGDFMRNLAIKLGVSLGELGLRAQTDRNIDDQIDEQVKKTGEKSKVVIDSRLAFHFIPESFKVYLDLPPEIAKERIFNNLKENALRREGEEGKNEDEIYANIIARRDSEKKRYMDLYNLDHTNKSNFDLVIDTNKNNLEEVVNIILLEYKKWREN